MQAFLPGEEGGPALAGVLSGRVTPSGKLPVQIPRRAGAQPSTYLHPLLGGNSEGVSNLDPTPLFPFGHGLSYTTFDYSDFSLSAEEIPTDGEVEVRCTVRNAGDRPGAEVVQLYLADPVASVTRPVIQLAGFARVPLEAGESARVAFRLHADRTAFTGTDLRRIVEPGEIQPDGRLLQRGHPRARDVRAHRRRARRRPRPRAHDAVLRRADPALTVRIGLVGYGFGGRRFHAPFIASAPGCALAGVVTRSPERRAELERDHPGVPAYDSLAERRRRRRRRGRHHHAGARRTPR